MHVCASVSFSQKLSTLESKQLFFYLVGALLHPVADLSRRNSLKAEGIQPQSGDVLGKEGTAPHIIGNSVDT